MMITAVYSTTAILVPLDEQTVAKLLSRRVTGESLADVINRLCSREYAASGADAVPTATEPLAGKYTATYFGETVSAETLPALFSQIVDMVANLDPAALERLADTKARTRRYISRTRDAIHPNRPDLPVTRTRTGWWISANVGVEDVVRSLRALTDAAGLSFGHDIQFPVGKS